MRTCQAQHPERPELRCTRTMGHSQWHQASDADGEWVEWDSPWLKPVRGRLSRQENNALAEREDKAAYDWGRGTYNERPDTGRVWRWW